MARPFTRQLPPLNLRVPTSGLDGAARELLAAGELTPVVDRTFPLEEVAAAIGTSPPAVRGAGS